jgi:hypothetical protein
MCDTAEASKSEGVIQFVTSAEAPSVCTQPHPTPKSSEKNSNVEAVMTADLASMGIRRHVEDSPSALVQAIAATPMSPGALIDPAQARKPIPR